jgi:uncharacterized SAM-binding protein YcdF (DUF218 family)
MNQRSLLYKLRPVFFGFLLVLMWFVYVQWKIHQVEETVPHEPADVGIVLGAALWNNVPSPALRERLEKALELYEEGYFSHIIVTGGLDYNGSTITEAQGMKHYLSARGVPEAVIFTENLATDTYENLWFSREIMKQNGWETAIIVTHTYHGARSLEIAEFLGYENAVVSTTDSQVMYMPWHKTRETLAFTKWRLQKWLISWNLL